MPKGIYAAASAMVTEQWAMDVTAENMANANSAGFKRSELRRGSFAEMLEARGRYGDLAGNGGAGVQARSTWLDFSPGDLHASDGEMDLALVGEGFFRVRDDQGDLLVTRRGRFMLDENGVARTSDGYELQGQGGAVTVPEGVFKIEVNDDGEIYGLQRVAGGAEQVYIDQLRIVKPTSADDYQKLMPRSGQYFEPGSVVFEDVVRDGPILRQGQIENANVNAVEELVNMVALQRRYDAAANALRRQFRLAGLSDILSR
ncbi:MAG: flagellar hook basal-body protein [Planctomycetota bacterium]|jgi:flagellar basal body rod protein FlgG|nr:flagellar hook basal-body protein [Planctomycetota bacterium]